MAFNGDGPHTKRQRTETDSANNRGHTGNYTSATEEPRRKRQDDSKPNHVLLFTIINPMYPITVDVLHTICQASGQVLRIVIFKKNGVQAMVEFDGIESAMRAKETLNGADIYSGCCTLKIDFAKPEKLNVHKNDSESWDYTVAMMKENTNGRPQPLLQEPHYGSRPQPYSIVSDPYPSEQQRYDEMCSAGPGSYGEPFGTAETYARKAGAPPPGSVTGTEYGGTRGDQRNTHFQQPGAVLMVYGLDPLRTNADKLFNLMCLYGNVARIKFLKSKEGTAMVQMGDSVAVERCVQNLNNVTVGLTGAAPLLTISSSSHHNSSLSTLASSQNNSSSQNNTNNSGNNSTTGNNGNSSSTTLASSNNGGNNGSSIDGGGGGGGVSTENKNNLINQNVSEHKLQLAFSKQPYLSEVTNPYPLPDKSPSYKEYITNKNNRFMNPAMASKNRIQPPSKILHFFNTPPQVTETELIQVFQDYDVVPPKAVKLFPMKSERSSSGLLEFENTTEAVAAVMACNHAAIESPGTKFPFIMKLCFSSSRSMTIRNGDNNSNGSGEKRDSDH